jgi:hypothetical protein
VSFAQNNGYLLDTNTVSELTKQIIVVSMCREKENMGTVVPADAFVAARRRA